jgi:hypothetical protein
MSVPSIDAALSCPSGLNRGHCSVAARADGLTFCILYAIFVSFQFPEHLLRRFPDLVVHVLVREDDVRHPAERGDDGDHASLHVERRAVGMAGQPGELIH